MKSKQSLKKIFHLIPIIIAIALVSGCAIGSKKQLPPPVAQPIIYQPLPQGGQLPLGTLKAASDRYGGSLPTEETAAAAAAAGAAAGQNPALAGKKTVVLGPVYFEDESKNAESASRDAGQKIREIISEQLSSGGNLTLMDAPEERYKDDSPRPDLSTKGIKLVLKGMISYSSSTNENIVFLRAVDTKSGEVAFVASGRAKNSDQAATDATNRLLEKLKGAL